MGLRKVFLSVISITLGLLCFSISSFAYNFKYYPIAEKSIITPGRGQWSVGDNDKLFDLAGKWQILNPQKGIPEKVIVPFAWNDWRGSLKLIKQFRLPDVGDKYNWKLVVDGAAISLNVSLNQYSIFLFYIHELIRISFLY